MDYIDFDLIPVGIKKLMNMIRHVAIGANMFSCSLLLLLWGFGFFCDLTTGISCSAIVFLVTVPLLIPAFKYDRLNQSKFQLTDDQIIVCDKHGNYWRTIPYHRVSSVRIEKIPGFYYGQNTNAFVNEYICLYLDGTTNRPEAAFSDLFQMDGFMILGFHKDALDWILRKTVR